jgi:hypothetical protein
MRRLSGGCGSFRMGWAGLYSDRQGCTMTVQSRTVTVRRANSADLRAFEVVFGCDSLSRRGAGEVINSGMPNFEGYPPPPIDLLGIQPAAPILRRGAKLMSGRVSCWVKCIVEVYIKVNVYLFSTTD